jgi:flagellar biosynthesis/type III secretory pathway protein FliH
MIQMYQHQQKNGQPMQPQQGNMLTEHVQNAVDGFMNEHFSGIVQEAMKNTIIEMYSVERVKKTLEENKDLIRNVVVEVIKELQQRKAAKSRN